VSAAIGLSISAGVVLAVEEWLWMKRTGRLTRPAVREMMLSLSALPPNLLVSVLSATRNEADDSSLWKSSVSVPHE
jgi:hypothetical protein